MLWRDILAGKTRNMPPPFNKIFDKQSLIPAGWRGVSDGTDFHTYNPAICQHGDTTLMAVRICSPDRLRKIALMRLGPDFSPLPESVTPLSDYFQFHDASRLDRQSLTWFADPRLFSAGERLFMHFNNGGVAPNRIFLVELNPVSLLPIEAVREVDLAGDRDPVEKNWIFFADRGEIFAIYRHCPFQLTRVDLDVPGRAVCRLDYRQGWDASAYADRFGEIRGGATPVRQGGTLITMFHSAYIQADRDMQIYVGGLLRLEPDPPFRPVAYTRDATLGLTAAELALPLRPSLNARDKTVFYPCGLTTQSDQLFVSYGVNDEYAAIRRIDVDDMTFEAL
jgi:predicted GH43/DUF377 family glycosyl hydrolase